MSLPELCGLRVFLFHPDAITLRISVKAIALVSLRSVTDSVTGPPITPSLLFTLGSYTEPPHSQQMREHTSPCNNTQILPQNPWKSSQHVFSLLLLLSLHLPTPPSVIQAISLPLFLHTLKLFWEENPLALMQSPTRECIPWLLLAFFLSILHPVLEVFVSFLLACRSS